MQNAAAPAPRRSIRYSDQGSYLWLWRQAPCVWRQNVTLHFTDVQLDALCPAGCWIDPSMSAGHLRRMRRGGSIAPLVVCDNGAGAWYIHDGNHRYAAMREFFADEKETQVRVAIAVPNTGFRFVYRWFGSYGTYLLEPLAPLLPSSVPLLSGGRVMVLVAHPDDETACAGLLQRLSAPLIVYATNGAPTDDFFWGRHGSREKYAVVRREEAIIALARAGISNPIFLNDFAPPRIEFGDQQLYRVLPDALDSLSEVMRRYGPEAVIVPAYEGGHPDHDCCSFLGAQLRQRFRLSVWEMPLYHRPATGNLTCQEFMTLNGTERAVCLGSRERNVRDLMIASYASQIDLRDFVSSGVELFRPQPEYDYARPPHAGTVNYEVWQWPILPTEVSRKFEECARTYEDVRVNEVGGFALAEREQAGTALAAR